MQTYVRILPHSIDIAMGLPDQKMQFTEERESEREGNFIYILRRNLSTDLRTHLRTNLGTNLRANLRTNLRTNLIQDLRQKLIQDLRTNLIQDLRKKLIQDLRKDPGDPTQPWGTHTAPGT